jgi:phosphoribosylformylglycinamidine cyclo-ligase
MRLRPDAPFPGTGRSVADELLEPTRIYVRPVLGVLKEVEVHAMAHVTGGGLPGNLPRVLPEGCRAVLRRGAWRVPPVFEVLRDAGSVTDAEMFRTFNMGVGYVVIVPPALADRAAAVLTAGGAVAQPIGEIVAGERGVEIAA